MKSHNSNANWTVFKTDNTVHFSGWLLIPAGTVEWVWIASFTEITEKPATTRFFYADGVHLQLASQGYIQTAQKVTSDTVVYIELIW